MATCHCLAAGTKTNLISAVKRPQKESGSRHPAYGYGSLFGCGCVPCIYPHPARCSMDIATAQRLTITDEARM